MESQPSFVACSALSNSSIIGISLISLSAPGFRCSLLLTSECGVRRFGERYDCVEEGLALAQEQAGIYQARRGRNRSRGIGVAGPDDGADGQVFIQKGAGFRHDVAAVRVLPNVGKARVVVAFEFADSFKGSLEDGEVVDLHGSDGGEDCHDVEVRDFSHKRVVEAASTLLDCSKVKGGCLCNGTELIAADRLGGRDCGLVDDVGYLGEGISEVGVSGLAVTLVVTRIDGQILQVGQTADVLRAFDGDAGQGAEGIEVDWCFAGSNQECIDEGGMAALVFQYPTDVVGKRFVDPLKGIAVAGIVGREFAILSPKIRFDEFSHCEELQYGYIAVAE